MMYLERSPIEYQINVLSFNKAGTALDANTFGTIYPFRVASNTGGYFSVGAKPGRYVLVSVHQQGIWAVCFHEHTIAFDVNPGEVAYLGHFDPTPHLAQLQKLAVESGRLSSNGSEVHFFDGIIPQRISPPTEEDMVVAKEFVAKNSPGTTAPIHAAQLSDAMFGIGRGLISEGLICGGFRERPIGSRD